MSKTYEEIVTGNSTLLESAAYILNPPTVPISNHPGYTCRLESQSTYDAHAKKIAKYISSGSPDLSDYTMPGAADEKFRQSVAKHGEDYQAVAKDCRISEKSYYNHFNRLFPAVVNITNSDDSDNNPAANHNNMSTIPPA